MTNPTQQQLDNLLEHYQKMRFNAAEKLAISITTEFPNHQLAWKVLGAIQIKTGRTIDSLIAMEKCIKLMPQDAEAHFNMGITLKELGRLDDAIESYRQAIFLQPKYTKAYINLGNALKELERLDDAIESYRQAIFLQPNFIEAHFNMGIIYEKIGRLDEAIASYAQVISLKPNFAYAYLNLGNIIKKIRFNKSNPKLYEPLIQLLTTGNFIRPRSIARNILSLLKHDPKINHFLSNKKSSLSLNEMLSIIRIFDKLPILHHLMRLCPLPDLQFESLFILMRNMILKNIDKLEPTSELMSFLSTLSINCFANEYIYIESNDETRLIEKLLVEILQTLSQSEQPEAIKILCLATYRPLHQYEWCYELKALDNLEQVKARLIEEPLAEKLIGQDIPVLKEISDDVSLKVRDQYEQNPYPRWVKLKIPLKANTIAEVCDELKLQLHSESIKNITAPSILIAGCGTGQQSIETAASFSNCHVTAVDLSIASLAYARRKSNELHFTNLDYLQADILHLHEINRAFDIIESIGVLHHMDEPMNGWKVLTDLLKPSGLMRIGLYSELARKQIVNTRMEIASLGIGTSVTEIRNFRNSLITSESNNQKILNTFSDFFSLSEFRDLVFHVQEHRFTIPQIKNCIDELGLKFCGFVNKVATSSFKEYYGYEADVYDLKLWDQFEKKYPQTFSNMYQFWCQKT